MRRREIGKRPGPPCESEEVPLDGGGRSAVWRRGGTVLREARPSSRTVHTLLRHLEREGHEWAPRVLGDGFDARGREVLSFVEGDFVHPGPWAEDAFPLLGRMLGELHAATRTYSPPPDATWAPWHGRELGSDDRVFGHCDAGPWNVVARAGLPVALIDWEVAGPVDPLVELTQVCWLNPQLHSDDIAVAQGLAPLETRARHVRMILDGYELPRAKRAGFVDRLIEFALCDAAAESEDAGVTADTTDAESLWAITWRIRSAAWMQRNKAALQSALVSLS